MLKNVVVIAGPAGSGKDSVARELLKRSDKFTMMVTATTRPKRPYEIEGVNYYFLSKEQFLKELGAGNILEHYHRPETDTYYGTYKPDLDKRIAEGKIVLCVVQVVGAQYLRNHYGATTIFINPPSWETLERRLRARAPMSETEWQERKRITQEEITHDAHWYDYRIENDDGKLSEAGDRVMEILRAEGYTV